jgi:hypothetical protein
VQSRKLSMGLLLYATTMNDETQPCVYIRGAFGGDGSGPNNNDKNDSEGPKSKREET